MGPIDAARALRRRASDSPYVVAMRLMTRMGSAAQRIEQNLMRPPAAPAAFVRLASTGELDPAKRFIMHFRDLSIKSIGSGYGGNALLGKKCHALRIASAGSNRRLARRAHTDPASRTEGRCSYSRSVSALRQGQLGNADSPRPTPPPAGRSGRSATTSAG
jgi:hypothetical protein